MELILEIGDHLRHPNCYKITRINVFMLNELLQMCASKFWSGMYVIAPFLEELNNTQNHEQKRIVITSAHYRT